MKFQPAPRSISNDGKIVGYATVYPDTFAEEVGPDEWEFHDASATPLAFIWDSWSTTPHLLAHSPGSVIDGNSWDEYPQIAADGSMTVRRRADTTNPSNTAYVVDRYAISGSSTTPSYPTLYTGVIGNSGFQVFNEGSANAYSWMPGASPVSLLADSIFSTPNPRRSFQTFVEPTYLGEKPGPSGGYCINFWGKAMVRSGGKWREATEMGDATLITKKGIAFRGRNPNSIGVWTHGNSVQSLSDAVLNKNFTGLFTSLIDSTAAGSVLIQYSGSGQNGYGFLLPVDLDIEYASQEGIKKLEESKEDTGDGGYISLKSQTPQGDDITPTTYLVISPIAGPPADRKVRLKFNSGGRYKVTRDRLGNDPVISEVTEFPAGQETRLYLVGETKSQARGGESITMQIANEGSWIDGDSLRATVVQTQFQIDLRIFIPYNWVNIPLHPGHVGQVAKGDTRSYDPTLNGTYRISQWTTLNLYREWIPEVGNRMIDQGKSAGTSEHYHDSDVTNFDSAAKHSEDTVVKPSYINAGATAIDSGTADLSRVDSAIIGASTNDDQCFARFEGSAAEPIIFLAADIDWQFDLGIAKQDPLNPTFFMRGVHDGFPAYEIYINAKHQTLPHTDILLWKPPLSADVLELSTNKDVDVGPATGEIAQ